VCVRACVCVLVYITHTHTHSQTSTWRQYSPPFAVVYRWWRSIDIPYNAELRFTDFHGHKVRLAIYQRLTVYPYIFWRKRQMFKLTNGLMTRHYNTTNDNFVTVFSLISLDIFIAVCSQRRNDKVAVERRFVCLVTAVCIVRCFNVRWMWALNILRIGCFAFQCHLDHILFSLECVL
jgi:hypothetical protein